MTLAPSITAVGYDLRSTSRGVMVQRPTQEPWIGWVAAAREGDTVAFERLYHRFFAVVKGLVLRHRLAHAVDDVVQDVFMTAWDKLGELRNDATFPGWIATIARRTALDARRKSGAEIDSESALALAADPRQVPPDAAFVVAAIRDLPEAYVEPLLLRLVAGCSGPEIAALTDLTPGSVRVNLHRGMAMLRQRLEGERP